MKRSLILAMLVLTSFLTATTSIEEMAKADNEFEGSDSKQLVKPMETNRVHRAGLFWVNMTNYGKFGNPESLKDPCTGKTAVSGELPGGSGTDFLFTGALLFGGYLNQEEVELEGVQATVFQGPFVTTGDEGWAGFSTYSRAQELWPVNFDEDAAGSTKGKIVESSNVEGKLSCLFEEVYDPFATAEEQFSLMYTDKYINNSYTGMCDYDQRPHIPLGIEILQKSYAWSYEYAQKFIIIDYTLYNRNEENKDIYNFFMGVYFDCDIGHTSGTSPSGFTIDENHADDLGGFIQKWDNYIDPATGQQKTVELNLAWAADNDGRNYKGNASRIELEPGRGAPLDGATSIATVRVLRNPNPNLRYAFNHYIAGQSDEVEDWGPRWQTGLHPRPASDHPDPLPHERRNDPRSRAWIYDLTMQQKGYDDYNQDNLRFGNSASGGLLYGGRTEGRPAGDNGRYMVMSNDEFDYDQTRIREIYLGLYEDPPNTEAQYAQASKWQKWTTNETLGQPGYAVDIVDGPIDKMNDIANGRDTKMILSFGPLGHETSLNIGWDKSGNGEADAVINNKQIWKFAHGDSLKLTIAFIVNENFHTSLDQDPNYKNDKIVDLSDGLNPDLWSKGWNDALRNVVWAERVYDMPMHDTKILLLGDEEPRSDGWYGEDVGKDAIFGDFINDTYCWWIDEEYQSPDPDGSEGNFDLDQFTAPVTDIYGYTSYGEDDLLPYGRKEESPDGKYGPSSKYGYMVQYDKEDGLVPMGTWVRYGFDNGRLDVGDGVPDFTGPPPPPSPQINVSIVDNDLMVEWQSHEFMITEDGSESYIGPEHFIDPFTRRRDFEGYQVQVSQDGGRDFVEIFSVDVENYVYESVSEPGRYLDIPVSEKDYLTLVAEGKQVIYEELKNWQLKNYGDNRLITENHQKAGIYTYEVFDDVREIKVSEEEIKTVQYKKYKFTLHNKTFLQPNDIAVTASDFGDPRSGTPPLKSNPLINAFSVIPSKATFSDKIIVTPNPYRGDVDYEKTAYENFGEIGDWSERSRMIAFWNVPSRCVLRIYTLSGDLVKTIPFNSNSNDETKYRYGENAISWDLINENNQAVVSGIYLYSIQDVDSSFEHVGKFVIIK